MSKYSAIRINSISVPNFTAWLSAKGTERPGMGHQSTKREGMKHQGMDDQSTKREGMKHQDMDDQSTKREGMKHQDMDDQSTKREGTKRQGTTSVVPKASQQKTGALAPDHILLSSRFTVRNINWSLRALLLAVTTAFLIAWAAIGHAATPDPDALLKRSDTYRNGWPAYVLRVKITNFESDKSDEESLYEVSQKGTDKTYVEFMSPRDKGRHLLMLGDDMWIYLPDTSRPVRIMPLERLSGDASNGDVARTNYAVDYTATYVRDEKVGNENCYVLNLAAKRKGATYQRIVYWIRVEDARPVRAEFYLTSGKHIKSATFDEYAPSDGKMLLKKLTLYDEIRHNSHSVLEYSNAAPRNLPDKLFYQGRSDRF